MKKKIGVIGLGNIAIRHRMNLRTLFPEAQIYAMSASGRSVEQDVDYADFIVETVQQLIDEQPYFVIVASPAPYHSKHALPLIQAQIPVLIEKPVTVSKCDLDTLKELQKETLTPVVVGYCLRYLSSAKLIKKYISEGLIGPIYNLSASFGQYLPNWRSSKDYRHSVSVSESLGGGVLLELSHEFDYIQWLLGKMTLQFAYLRSSYELKLNVEELADVVLTSEKGTVCNVHLDFLQKKVQRTCSFIGANGRLDWDLQNNSISMYNNEIDKVLYSEPQWDKNNMYLAMLADFVNCIENKEHNCIELQDVSDTVDLIIDIKQQAIWGVTQ